MEIFIYSVLKATTGSFFAAFRDGIKPPIIVIIMLIIMRITAAPNGSFASRSVISVSSAIIAFIGCKAKREIIIPIKPEQQPMIKVSALKT